MILSIVNDFRTYLRSRRGLISQHAWVALALASLALAAYVGVTYGNSYGSDDFDHLYRTCQTRNTEMVGRPLALGIVYELCPYFGASPLPYFLALLGFRAVCAFLLYVLIWQVCPGQPLFAFACGAGLATFMVNDSHFV